MSMQAVQASDVTGSLPNVPGSHDLMCTHVRRELRVVQLDTG